MGGEGGEGDKMLGKSWRDKVLVRGRMEPWEIAMMPLVTGWRLMEETVFPNMLNAAFTIFAQSVYIAIYEQTLLVIWTETV